MQKNASVVEGEKNETSVSIGYTRIEKCQAHRVRNEQIHLARVLHHILLQPRLNELSVDLGSISSTGSPVVWALGLIRDPVIQTVDADNNTVPRRAYYWSNDTDLTDIDIVRHCVHYSGFTARHH